VPVYTPDLIATIISGKNSGELGYKELTGGGGDILPSRPAFLGNEIFILDNLNWRVSVYDLNMELEKKIKVTGSQQNIPIQSGIIYVYENGDISASRGVLSRIGSDGRTIYEIPYDQLPKNLTSQAKYWLFKNCAVFYRENGDLGAVDAKGRFLSPDEITQLRDQMNSTSSIRKESPELRDAIDNFLKQTKLVIIGNRLLTDDVAILFQYYMTFG